MQRVGYYFEIEYFWLGTFFITDDEWYDYLILDRRQSPLNVGYRVRVKFSSCFSNQIYLYILTWCEHNRRIDLVDHSPSCISPSVSVQVENYPLILTPEKSERNARSCQSSTHASSQFPNANGLDSCPVMVSFRLLSTISPGPCQLTIFSFPAEEEGGPVKKKYKTRLNE